jgi:hypothetical protein
MKFFSALLGLALTLAPPLANAAQDDICVTLAPEATDPAIDRWLAPHLICHDPSARQSGRLLLFYAGSRAVPDQYYRTLLKEAALSGHHAIGLSYSNDKAVEWQLCRNSGDPSCNGKVRLEQLTGEDVSQVIDVSRANSIEHRLARALSYLAEKRPQQGWNNFLQPDGSPKWDAIIVAGHSQGGGEALMTARRHEVARLVMFAWTDFRQGKLDPWITQDARSATPTERFYAFRHLRDRIDETRAVWRFLKLDAFGPEVDVSRSAPPYGNTHMLVASMLPPQPEGVTFRGAPLRAGLWPHMVIAADPYTPVDADGRPYYAPVWRYLWGAD